jgi:hypothetical protein
VSPAPWRGGGQRAGGPAIVLGVAAAVAAAAAVRAAIDLATPLVPKVNGAYYLVQVRALLETGRLAFPDFPLVFFLEAALAKLLAALGVGGTSGGAIVAAVKAVDIALPPLAAVPLGALALRLRPAGDARRWPAIAAAAFGVLSLPAVMMTGDLQKNALGMLAMAVTILAAHAALERGGALRWAAAAAALGVAGLSHAGAFAATIGFAVVAGCIAAALSRPGRWRPVLAAVAIVAAALAVLAGVLWATDRARFARMAGVLLDPLSLFRRPVLVTAFSGAAGLPGLANALLASTIAALGLAVLVRRWKQTDTAARAVVGACTLLSLLLSSPLIGEAWSERLSLMACLPASVALGYLLAVARRPAFARTVAAVAGTACAAGIALSVGPLSVPSIPPGSVAELRQAAAMIADPDHTLVIARHGLEWWAAWHLRTKVAQELDLAPSVWDEYAAVFMLVQKPSDGPTAPGARSDRARGPGGPGIRQFPEVRLGDDARVVHDGRYFLLALEPTPPAFYPLARPEE